jgi:hypothetical protein
MNRKWNITSTSLNRDLTAWLVVALLVFAAATVSAHGGFEHFRGTIIKVANNVLTVKTATGNVDVKLDGKTEFTKNDRKAQPADLTPGARVIVDVMAGSKDKIAHSVKIGTVTKTASAHAHGSH